MATTGIERPGELLSERVAGGMLPRVLNTFDMVAIFVSIVLFITNAAVIQSAGPAAFGWWIIGFLAFLIPGAIVTGQLGRMCALIIAFIVTSAVLATQRFRLTQNIVNVVFVLYALAIGLVVLAGAEIAYGTWFYLVGGMAALSLLVAVGIYWLGKVTRARARAS